MSKVLVAIRVSFITQQSNHEPLSPSINQQILNSLSRENKTHKIIVKSNKFQSRGITHSQGSGQPLDAKGGLSGEH